MTGRRRQNCHNTCLPLNPIVLKESQDTSPGAFLAPSPLAGEGWGEGGRVLPMAWFADSGRMDHPSPYPLPQGERVNEVLTSQGLTTHSTVLPLNRTFLGGRDHDREHRTARPAPGHHTRRDPDIHSDPRCRPGLAGHALSDRPAAAPGGPAPVALGVPLRISRRGCDGTGTAESHVLFLCGFSQRDYLHELVLLPGRGHGIQPADPGYALLTVPMRSCSTRIILRVPSTSRSAPSRPLRVATACRSRTIRSGGGKPITPTAASISMTRPA